MDKTFEVAGTTGGPIGIDASSFDVTEGTLTIFDETSMAIAVFARGCWSHIIDKTEPEAA